MLRINYYDLGGMSLEQMIGFEMAGLMWGHYFTDDVSINIGVQTSTTMEEYVIGGATPMMYEQHYGIYQEYLQNDISSADDDLAYYYLQDGNTVDFMIDGELVDGNSQILLSSAQAKALGMDEAFDLDLDEIQDLLGLQRLANKLALDLQSQHQQAISDGLSWTSEQQQALNTAQVLAAELEVALDYVWNKILTNTAYDQLDQYLQGNLVLDANAIQYQDINQAESIAAKLDQDLHPVRDLATQLSQQLTDSYEAQYLQQQLSVAVDKLAVIFEQDKGTWTRDLVDSNAVDGYITLNDDFAWDYNYLRDEEAPESTLDFLSVALHETGHILGFTSGIDYSLEQETLYSGKETLSNFTPLDLFRFSAASADTYNPDGSVADLSGNWFSIDGGQTILAILAQGIDGNGDGYQASHWERRYDPQGIMDPTLWYQERATISGLDVQAMDLLGWDLSDDALAGDLSLNLDDLLLQAKINIAQQLGMTVAEIEASLNGVPLSDSDAVAAADAAIADGTIDTTDGTDTTGGTDTSTTTSNIATIDEFKQWWLENSKHEDDKIGNPGEFQKLWKSAYNFWYGTGDNAQVWWQDLYNWWFGSGDDSGDGYWNQWEEEKWEENAYHWWFGSGDDSGDGYWWWFGSGDDSDDGYWQSVENKAWWEQVFFATANPDAVIELLLPGEQDTTNTNSSTSTLAGGAEDDIFGGFVGNDDISAGDGDDLIDGADGDDTLRGEAGNDTIFGFNGNDQIYGGTGDDVLSGENGNDAIYGEAGADVVFGGRGDDFISGGEGRDFLVAGVGNDAVFGGADDDVIEGEAGNDLLVGENGRDMIGGGSGDDLIFGDSYGGNTTSTTEIYLNDLRNKFSINSSGSVSSSVSSSNTDTSSSSSDSNNSDPTTGGVTDVVLDTEPIKVQAENLSWTGTTKVDNKNFASGGSYIFNDAKNSTITTSTTFTGETGLYNVIIGYYDSRKAADARIKATLAGEVLDDWQLNLELGSDNPDEKIFVTRTIASGININTGAELQLEGIRGNNDDKVFIDYIEYVPYDPTETVKIEAEYFNLSGNYKVENNQDFASSLRFITSDSNVTATTTFSGVSGQYDVLIGYYDSNEGNAQVTAKVAGGTIGSLNFNQNRGSNKAEAQTFVKRSIASGVTINQGDEFKLQGTADDKDKVFIDYVEFVPVIPPTPDSSSTDNSTDNSDSNNSSTDTSPAIATVKFEAENMTLAGDYQLEENQTFASNNALVGTTSVNGYTLTSNFTGGTGFYDVIIGYYDENDGNSEITVKVGGVEVDKWLLDQELGNSLAGSNNFVKRTIAEGIVVNEGDKIFLQGIANANERARIDYIEFVAVEDPNLQLSDNSDILRGGGGNDVIYGDLGNDLIYGEDEFNDGTVRDINLTGGYTYGQSTYILSTAATWEAAQAEARSLGGNLVTINDAAEENWLKQTFGTNELWIGLTDKDAEGIFKWASREDVTYTNWVPGEPNNSGTNADYVRMNYNGQWGDLPEDSQRRGIIEIDWSVAGGNDTLVGGSGDDVIYGNSGNDVIYGDGIDSTATANTSGTLTFQQGMNGYSGTVDTYIHGGTPDTNNSGAVSLNVDGDNDGAAVQGLIRFDNIFGSQTGQIASDATINSAFLELEVFDDGDSLEMYEMLQSWTDTATWNSLGNGIQANGTEAKSTSVATTGSVNIGKLTIDVTATLQAWQANPNANHGWAFLPTGTDGVDFNSAEGGIAPRLVVDINQGAATSDIPDGAITYNNSAYLLTDSPMSWDDAQAQAESLGGNLVTINDAAEEQWIKDNFGSSEDFWIGFTDQGTEGQWEWVSGQEVTYTNWHPDNPNNLLNQDHALMNYFGQWDDDYSSKSYRGVIEIELSDIARLLENGGNDKITGGSGHDIINGGAGNDIINGTDAIAAGKYERDRVTGGGGADRFILGDATQSYYLNPDNRGNQDYVTIKDFVAGEDVVQLHGTAGDYQTQLQGSDMFLSRSGDLVAIFEGVTSLDITSSGFEYV